MDVTELGIPIEVKPVHSLNADLPIEVTELGMNTEVKPLQPLNADSPIEVTLSEIVTASSDVCPSNVLAETFLPR
jgi:hypothetical protein